MENDSGIRVLIVDDHEGIRKRVGDILTAGGDIRIVGEAADGNEAVDMVRKHSPDIVVMDIRMPNMDGIQATKIIAGLPQPCKVIVLTNHDQQEYIDLAIEAGASGFVSKDVIPKQLLQAVRLVERGERAFTSLS